jgi:hypothetical protein
VAYIKIKNKIKEIKKGGEGGGGEEGTCYYKLKIYHNK